MQQAFDRYIEILGEPPATHGAAGWQMNATAFRQIDAWGMAYASDGRGTRAHIPVVEGRSLAHVQLPTTLPTLDEIIGRDGVDAANVASRLLAHTTSDADQVYTLHAELEGGELGTAFTELVRGWRAQGHRPMPLRALHARLDRDALPRLDTGWGRVAGRSGELVIASERTGFNGTDGIPPVTSDTR